MLNGKNKKSDVSKNNITGTIPTQVGMMMSASTL
jgi:hypothetical protein